MLYKPDRVAETQNATGGSKRGKVKTCVHVSYAVRERDGIVLWYGTEIDIKK